MAQIEKKLAPAVKGDGDAWYTDAFFSLFILGAAAYTYYELTDLQNGTIDSVKMWVPLVWLYNHFGRTGPVALIAALGVYIGIVAIRKFNARKRS